jgi:hypothetical protein
MYDLSVQGVNSAQVIAMADGLAANGHADAAKALYLSALKREKNVAMRLRLRLRIGLATSSQKMAPGLLRMLQELEREHANSPVFVGGGLATWLKTVPFMDDERFLELAEKHAHLLPIANWHWNLQVIAWAVQHTREVKGDLVELGVFKGHTTAFTAEYVDFQTWPKRWFLFDTFDGIPDDQVDPGWERVNQGLYKGTYHHAEVAKRFEAFPSIEVVQGRVPEILHERCPEAISFLHIDLNNTAAELAALDVVIERLSPGAVLVLDDYGWATARAQFVAERRWFGERGLHVLPLPTGQGVFVKH